MPTVTCQGQYQFDLEKLDQLEAYARVWMVLIKRYGGTHHGYFMPGAVPRGVKSSFPEIASNGPDNVAIALFTFR